MNNLNSFRKDIRSWLAENCPHAMRTPMLEKDVCRGGRNPVFQSEEQQIWLKRMSEKGWTAPTWPVEYGGAGFSKDQAKILREELSLINARPPISGMGISMIGPAILEFGSEKLKQQHLPAMAKGEVRWCQGYSEPNSGSDLAGLQTKAENFGDHLIVNGQKVWTSYGHDADWMFCLVRTNSDVGKHSGISLVLFDMETPGVSTKPIKLISGTSVFCETYLDNVRVDIEQVVGDIDAGWTVAKYLLTHEREMLGKLGTAPTEKSVKEHALDCLGVCNDRLADEVMRKELIDWEIDYLCHQLTMERVNAEIASNGVGNTSAMLKYYGTELNKRKHELLVSIHGSDSMHWENNPISRQWLRSKGNSIEGGTSEIQLNIISKRILGLG